MLKILNWSIPIAEISSKNDFGTVMHHSRNGKRSPKA